MSTNASPLVNGPALSSRNPCNPEVGKLPPSLSTAMNWLWSGLREKRRTPNAPPGVAGHPSRALLTPWIRQLIGTVPLCWQSNEGHALTGALPSAMFTPVTNSLIVTMPLPSQSPTHAAVVPVGTAVAVGVGVAV